MLFETQMGYVITGLNDFCSRHFLSQLKIVLNEKYSRLWVKQKVHMKHYSLINLLLRGRRQKRIYHQCDQIWQNTPLGQTVKVFGYSLRVYFVFGKTLTLIGQIFMKLNKFSLLLMAQYWKDHLAIWSRCLTYTFTIF